MIWRTMEFGPFTIDEWKDELPYKYSITDNRPEAQVPYDGFLGWANSFDDIVAEYFGGWVYTKEAT